jgi:hypothetical protein
VRVVAARLVSLFISKKLINRLLAVWLDEIERAELVVYALKQPLNLLLLYDLLS